MTFIKQLILGRNPQDWFDFLVSVNCPRITIYEGAIYIGDVYCLSIADTGDISLTVEDEEITVPNNPLIDAGGSFVTIICNDGFVWLTIKSSSANNKTFMLFYEIVDELHLYAYKFASGVNFANIGELHAKDDTENTYSHITRLNFIAVTGYIKFTDSIVFQLGNPNVRAGIAPHFYDCTTLTANQLVTFAMHDYYALSSNLLIPLDLEEPIIEVGS